MKEPRYDEQLLFECNDGPEGVKIYISHEKAVVDWSSDIPALYIQVSVHGAFVVFGPFQMKSIREAFMTALNKGG